MNEAVRLFFAVSALILVGMLAGSEEPAMVPPLSAQWSQSQPKSTKVASADKKLEKSERKITRKTAAVKKS